MHAYPTYNMIIVVVPLLQYTSSTLCWKKKNDMIALPQKVSS